MLGSALAAGANVGGISGGGEDIVDMVGIEEDDKLG
jgi:hypothetical protein